MMRDDAGIDTGIALNIANKISEGLLSNEFTDNESALLEHLALPLWFMPYATKVRYMSSKAAVVGILRIALTFMWFKVKFPDKRV